MFVTFKNLKTNQKLKVHSENCNKTIVKKKYGKSFITPEYQISTTDSNGKLLTKMVDKIEYDNFPCQLLNYKNF